MQPLATCLPLSLNLSLNLSPNISPPLSLTRSLSYQTPPSAADSLSLSLSHTHTHTAACVHTPRSAPSGGKRSSAIWRSSATTPAARQPSRCAWLLHGCCMGVAWVLHGCCMAVAWLLHGCRSATVKVSAMPHTIGGRGYEITGGMKSPTISSLNPKP
jgi:hypothetical protein